MRLLTLCFFPPIYFLKTKKKKLNRKNNNGRTDLRLEQNEPLLCLHVLKTKLNLKPKKKTKKSLNTHPLFSSPETKAFNNINKTQNTRTILFTGPTHLIC